LQTLLLFFILALIVSFICSILEAILLSINQSYISVKLKNKKKYAEYLQKYRIDIEKPLTAILTLNTFANTLGAAGVGAQAQILWGNEYLTMVSVILTVSILIFSEIIPKTIGANYWKNLAPFAAYILNIMIFIIYPFIIIVPYLTKFLRKKEEDTEISRDEFSEITDLVSKEGVLEEEESKIIKNLLQFESITAIDIMTPRTVVFSNSENSTIKELYDDKSIKHFSRIPIYRENLDNISGYVLKEDLLIAIIQNNPNNKLKEYKRKINKVNESIPLPDLYQLMIEKNEHIVAVIDEYEAFEGIVTMEDIIETLLGIEIMDESDAIEDMQEYARKNWKYRATKLGLIDDTNINQLKKRNKVEIKVENKEDDSVNQTNYK